MKNPIIKIEKNIDIRAHRFGGVYATASKEMEKGDSCFFKTEPEARKMEQALKMTYRRMSRKQSLRGIVKSRQQKDDDGNIVGYRVWLMVDMPEESMRGEYEK